MSLSPDVTGNTGTDDYVCPLVERPYVGVFLSTPEDTQGKEEPRSKSVTM